jgi:hypothetical protein
MLTQKVPERLPLMGGGVIQQDDYGAAQMPQQLPQERTDLFLPDVVKEKQIVQGQVVSLGTERNPGDDRNFVPSPLAMPMDGGLPLRGPGSGHRGN